jgi:hypothetical protein
LRHTGANRWPQRFIAYVRATQTRRRMHDSTEAEARAA